MQIEKAKDVFLVGFVIFMTVIGILFWLTSKGDTMSRSNGSNSLKVDCKDSYISQNNPYCNGEAEADFQEQDHKDDNYYQNIVR